MTEAMAYQVPDPTKPAVEEESMASDMLAMASATIAVAVAEAETDAEDRLLDKVMDETCLGKPRTQHGLRRSCQADIRNRINRDDGRNDLLRLLDLLLLINDRPFAPYSSMVRGPYLQT